MSGFTPDLPLLGPNQTLVALRPDGTLWSSEARGIKPLLDALANGLDLKGARCRDKIVGRAAAFLFVRAEVASVAAPIMAKGATQILARHAIAWEAQTITEGILNRSHTGSCPMEKAVAGISDDQPEVAEQALRQTLAQLMANAKVQS